MRKFIQVLKPFFVLPPLDPVLDHPYAKATKPDDIIAAHILASFAKNFEDWTVSATRNGLAKAFPNLIKLGQHDRAYTEEQFDITFVNTKENISVVVEYDYSKSYYDTYYARKVKGGKVNGFSFCPTLLMSIHNKYDALKVQLAEAKRVAAEAKKRMEENEAKWNLAEKLLGMRRNEFGALVPIHSPDTPVAPPTEASITKPKSRAKSAGLTPLEGAY